MSALLALSVVTVTTTMTTTNVYAERRSPPQPDTPAEDNPIAGEAATSGPHKANRGGCASSTEAGVVGLNGIPQENCISELGSTSGHGDCQTQGVGLHPPDEEQGAANFPCGHPPPSKNN